MSFPPPPGSGQNPYGEQPGQPGGYPQQPGGYPQQQGGYPQQQPGGYPPQQPGGYPQQQYPQPGGYPQYPGGPSGMPHQQGPAQMPGSVKTARVFHFVFGGLFALAALGMFAAASVSDDPDFVREVGYEIGGGVFAVLGLIFLALAVTAIVVGVKFGNGGSGVRVLSIVLGSLFTLSGLSSLSGGQPLGLLVLTGGILVIVFSANSAGREWFNRPKNLY